MESWSWGRFSSSQTLAALQIIIVDLVPPRALTPVSMHGFFFSHNYYWLLCHPSLTPNKAIAIDSCKYKSRWFYQENLTYFHVIMTVFSLTYYNEPLFTNTCKRRLLKWHTWSVHFPGHCLSLKIAHRSSFIRLHPRFVSRGRLFTNFLVSINMRSCSSQSPLIMLNSCAERLWIERFYFCLLNITTCSIEIKCKDNGLSTARD